MFLPAGTAQCRNDVLHRCAARALDQNSGVFFVLSAKCRDQVSLIGKVTSLVSKCSDGMSHQRSHRIER